MAKTKFKIDENWDGIVLQNTVAYEPGDIFETDESLGEGRPWLIKVPKNAIVSDKAKDEIKPKDAGKKEVKRKAEEDAIKEITNKKIAAKEKPKAKSIKEDEAKEDVK